mgnify:CR=1 FL=1
MILQEEEGVVESSEALLSSLSILLDRKGNIIIEQKGVPIEDLKKALSETFPSWSDLQGVVDTARWIDESITDLNKYIMKEYGDHESIRVQERNV